MVRTPNNFTRSNSRDDIETESEDNVALPVKSLANCVNLINWWNTKNNESKREKAFRVLNQPPERTFVHKRSYSLPVLETLSGSIKQRERRWPLHFCEFYNGRSLLRFEMMRNMWSRTWLTKLIAQRAEICKFNPCLCIISSSTGIIFFLTVFWKS